MISFKYLDYSDRFYFTLVKVSPVVSSVFRMGGGGAKALCLFTNNHFTFGVGEFMYSHILFIIG